MAAGLDSLGSMEFVAVLSQRLRLPLRATLPFNHPTAAAVAEHITSMLTAQHGITTIRPSATLPLPVAVTGQPARFSDTPPADRAVGIAAAVSQPLVQTDYGEAALPARTWLALTPYAAFDGSAGMLTLQKWTVPHLQSRQQHVSAPSWPVWSNLMWTPLGCPRRRLRLQTLSTGCCCS